MRPTEGPKPSLFLAIAASLIATSKNIDTRPPAPRSFGPIRAWGGSTPAPMALTGSKTPLNFSSFQPPAIVLILNTGSSKAMATTPITLPSTTMANGSSITETRFTAIFQILVGRIGDPVQNRGEPSRPLTGGEIIARALPGTRSPDFEAIGDAIAVPSPFFDPIPESRPATPGGEPPADREIASSRRNTGGQENPERPGRARARSAGRITLRSKRRIETDRTSSTAIHESCRASRHAGRDGDSRRRGSAPRSVHPEVMNRPTPSTASVNGGRSADRCA